MIHFLLNCHEINESLPNNNRTCCCCSNEYSDLYLIELKALVLVRKYITHLIDQTLLANYIVEALEPMMQLRSASVLSCMGSF